MDHQCHFRTCRECSCDQGECRVSRPLSHVAHRLARFERARTRGARALHVAATCLAFCIVLAGVLLAAESGIKRQDMIMQEEIAWQR